MIKEILGVVFFACLIGVFYILVNEIPENNKSSYIVINNGDTLFVENGLIKDIKHKK